MIALLQVVKGTDADRGRSAAVGTLGVTIGRGSDAVLRLQDPGVSRLHCRVLVKEGKAWLTDSGSASGTTINGAGVREQELHNGDMIRIGNTEIQFHWTDSDEHTTTGWTTHVPPASPSAD